MRSAVSKVILLGFIALAGACTHTPQTNTLQKALIQQSVAQTVRLNVPFYPQEQFYCGPTTLAEVFEYYGTKVAINEIAQQTFVPGKEGTFKPEMVAATRANNFIAYSKKGSLKELVKLLNNGHPVIIFQNNGFSWSPLWHFAVVTGYDLASQQFVLHSGITQDYQIPFSLLERTWRAGDFWMLTPLPIATISDALTPYVYIKSANDLIETNNPDQGIKSLIAATEYWPDYWLSYFLIANGYIDHNLELAIEWFEKGAHIADLPEEYLNNYGYALFLNGEIQKGTNLLKEALASYPKSEIIQASLINICSKNELDFC
jgi:tetratricopeptide (TPR) repeat protein